jgi:hypothetical protein
MTYLNSAYQNSTSYLSNQTTQPADTAYRQNTAGGSSFPAAQAFGNFSASPSFQNIIQGQTSQIQQPLLIQTGGGKGGKKGQANISVIGGYNNIGGSQGGGNTPLILQTSGGKGGKKGQSNIVLGGGYGQPGAAGSNFANGPLLLQTGGGKGGKKGQATIALVGGYGLPQAGGNQPVANQPAGNQYQHYQPTGNQPTGNQPTGNQPTGNQPTGNQPTGNQYPHYQQNPGVSQGHFETPANTPAGQYGNGYFGSGEQVAPHRGGGNRDISPPVINNFNNYPGSNPAFGGNNGGTAGFTGPLILQTGGGKGGKKGQSNIVLGGGYGFGNQGFGGFNSPLILQTGGGKGGKKGISNVSLVGGYGLNPPSNTINNFFQNSGYGQDYSQYGNSGGSQFGYHSGGNNYSQYNSHKYW